MSRSSMSRSGHRDDENEDDEWLFESIVAYLNSPIWSIPIQHFIESNCSIFSPSDGWSGGALMTEDDDDDDEENVHAEYLDVHSKYKDLVDTLINTFLQDIGVSYSQFTRACKKSSRFSDHPVYFELFEQVWCAENFKLFKSQMVRKNVELELQALVLLQCQLGLIKTGDNSQENDDQIMALVIKKSKDEYDSLMNTKQKSPNPTPNLPVQKPQDIETAKKIANKSDRIVESLKNELDQQDLLNKKIIEEQLTKSPVSNSSSINLRDRPLSAKRTNLNDDSKRTFNLEKLNLEDRRKRDEDDDDIVAGARGSESSHQIVNNLAQNYLAQSGGNVSEGELQRRADFMQKQRELLAEKKRVEREKQLDKFMRQSEQSGAPKRPQSSRAARSLLSGADPQDIKQVPAGSSRGDDERKRIEARKALAETLKKEVINSKK